MATAEPDPKRQKIEEEKGWDLMGEYDYYIYWGKDEIKRYPEIEGLDLEQFHKHFDNAKNTKGFDITERRPHRDYGFYLILPRNHSDADKANAPDFIKFSRYSYHRNCVDLLAPAAVAFHNKKTGSQLKFVSWVKAHHYRCWGYFYFITLVAQDECTHLFKKCLTRVFLIPNSTSNRLCHTVESFSIAGNADEPQNAPPHPTSTAAPKLDFKLFHSESLFMQFKLPS